MDEARSVQSEPESGQGGLVRLRLFVAGNSPRSNQTIQTIRQMCDEHIPGNYQLEIVDIYQQPAMARQEQILATPTLIRQLPQPKKILIGNLSQTDRVLNSLGLGS